MRHNFAGVGLAVLMSLGLSACGGAAGSALKVGDCINNEPSEDGPTAVHVDCAQPHAQEVFYVFDLPKADFPGYLEIGDAQQDECPPAFKDYVGVDWEGSKYTFTFAGPTEQTWAAGNHAVVCLLEDANGGTLTGSAKGTAQ
jgi:hypothetical protein